MKGPLLGKVCPFGVRPVWIWDERGEARSEDFPRVAKSSGDAKTMRDGCPYTR